MFLSLMESILMVTEHTIDYIRIIFNMMKVWYLFYSSLESIELVNQIIPHVMQVENDDNPLVLENEDDYDKLKDGEIKKDKKAMSTEAIKKAENNISEFLKIFLKQTHGL